jgi:hypothetical protein
MRELILTMIAANNDFENELGFTKNDIDNFIKKYDFFDEDAKFTERGYLVLWNNKYITTEEFAKAMDIEYKDNKFWLIVNSFDDILGKDYKFEIEVLDNEYDWEPSDSSYTDIDNYWSDYDEDTLKEIIKYCTDKGLEIEGEDGEDEELITDENTYIKNNERGKPDIYFKYESGKEIKFSKLIDEDGLDDLKTELSHAIGDAQDTADQDKYYTKIINAFEEKVGYFERREVKVKDYKGVESNVEKVCIRLDNIDFKEVEQFLIDDYGEYDFEEEKYGSLFYILREMEYFDFRKPYYDHIYGSIDDSILNEYTRDKLNW